MSGQSPVVPMVRIEASLMPRLNLAFHQNSVPFLRELVIVTDEDATLADVELTLSSDPGFLKPRTWRIDAIGAGQRFHVPDLDVAPDAGLLARLIESVKPAPEREPKAAASTRTPSLGPGAPSGRRD